jgi:hypothetical protein
VLSADGWVIAGDKVKIAERARCGFDSWLSVGIVLARARAGAQA